MNGKKAKQLRKFALQACDTQCHLIRNKDRQIVWSQNSFRPVLKGLKRAWRKGVIDGGVLRHISRYKWSLDTVRMCAKDWGART